MSFAIEHMGNNLWRGKFTSFDEKICQHAFSARLGGESVKPYKGLNMALKQILSGKTVSVSFKRWS